KVLAGFARFFPSVHCGSRRTLRLSFFSQVIFFTARSAKVFAGFARFFSLRSPRDSWRNWRLSFFSQVCFTARFVKVFAGFARAFLCDHCEIPGALGG